VFTIVDLFVLYFAETAIKICMLTELKQRSHERIWYNATGISEQSKMVNVTVPTKFSDYNDLLKMNQHVMMRLANESLQMRRKYTEISDSELDQHTADIHKDYSNADYSNVTMDTTADLLTFIW